MLPPHDHGDVDRSDEPRRSIDGHAAVGSDEEVGNPVTEHVPPGTPLRTIRALRINETLKFISLLWLEQNETLMSFNVYQIIPGYKSLKTEINAQLPKLKQDTNYMYKMVQKMVYTAIIDTVDPLSLPSGRNLRALRVVHGSKLLNPRVG